MGIYLYGLKKLSRPQRITREDGAVVTATHTLNYRLKLSLGWADSQRQENLIVGQLANMHPDGRFKGFVLHSGCVIDWDGNPYWYDTDAWPGKVWGVATDLTGDDDSRHPEKAKASKARLESLCLAAVSRVDAAGKAYTSKATLHRLLMVLTPEKRVVATQEVYAVKLPSGALEFRGAGFGPAFPLRGGTDDEVFKEFEAFCAVASDWLHEHTLPPAPPSQEQVAS